MADVKVVQEVEEEYTGPIHALAHGVRIPFYGTLTAEEFADFQLDLGQFQTRPDDVYIVTYPKSGTTWVQEIVWQIYHNGEVSTEKIFIRVPMFEMSILSEKPGNDSKPALESQPSPRIIKSHLPYHVIPRCEDEADRSKYIYVARNPKDAAISYYHFVRSFGPASGFHGTWEFFAKLLLEGKGAYGLWSDNVLPWWERRHEKHILFLKYEDLKKDLYSGVRAISDFLGKPLSDQMLARITEQCTFKGMMKNSASFTISRVPSNPSFLRKGEVGDWKNYFDEELNKKFEEQFLTKLNGTGLQFDME